MFRRKKRNRKKVAVKIGVPRKFGAVLIVLAVFALVYLWVCSRCEILGENIRRLEQAKQEISLRAQNEEFRWLNAKTPQRIEGLLEKHGLEMSRPDERNIVRLGPDISRAEASEPAPDHQQFAHQLGSSMND